MIMVRKFKAILTMTMVMNTICLAVIKLIKSTSSRNDDVQQPDSSKACGDSGWQTTCKTSPKSSSSPSPSSLTSLTSSFNHPKHVEAPGGHDMQENVHSFFFGGGGGKTSQDHSSAGPTGETRGGGGFIIWPKTRLSSFQHF